MSQDAAINTGAKDNTILLFLAPRGAEDYF